MCVARKVRTCIGVVTQEVKDGVKGCIGVKGCKGEDQNVDVVQLLHLVFPNY